MGNNEESFVDKGKRIAKNNLIPGFKAGLKQKAMAFAGGGLGTALAMKRGRNLDKAIRGAGLLGMAAGDTLGSIAIPQHALYKKHKKEFGTAPDAKSVGKVFAVNTLPTAASWGAILGSKKGRKLFGDGYATPAMNMKKGFKVSKEGINSIRQQAQAGKINKEDVGPAVRDAMKKGFKAVKESGKESGKAAGKMFIADKIMDKAVEAPTYVITPDSIIAKKKKERAKNMNNEESFKNAAIIVDYEFNKIARELSKKQIKREYKKNKEDFKNTYSDAGLDFKGALKYRPSRKEQKDLIKDQNHVMKSNIKGLVGGGLAGGLLGAGSIYNQMARQGHPWGRDITRQMALKAGGSLAALGALTGQSTYGVQSAMSRAQDRKAQRFEKALDKKFGRENTVRVEQGGKKALREAYVKSLMNSRKNQ